jgi:hypothetical protein
LASPLNVGAAGYDFFVSCTQADLTWAEWIAWDLEEIGQRVLIQAWDFVPGSNWITRMQDGVTAAERTIAVLSHAYQVGEAEAGCVGVACHAGSASALRIRSHRGPEAPVKPSRRATGMAASLLGVSGMTRR